MIIGWIPPWQPGGLQYLTQPGRHIFCGKLPVENLDFAPVKESWKQIDDSRLSQYAASIPEEWADARPAVETALELIGNARDRIEACLIEVRRVLT
jgi:hypothetical protein